MGNENGGLTRKQSREQRKEEWQRKQQSALRQQTVGRMVFWVIVTVVVAGGIFALSRV